MKLTAYSLKGILYEGEVVSINAKTAMGEITVLNHHRPLLSILTEGVVKVVDKEKKDHYIPVQSGFLEVDSKNRVKLLIDGAQ